MSLKFRVGGRTVSRSEFTRSIENEVKPIAGKALVAQVRAVRCPVHHQTPTNVHQTARGIEFACCCDALKQAVARRLR